MKPIKVMAALAATAILCIAFASCSKEPEDNSPTFKFDYNTVVTNKPSEEVSESVTQPSTETTVYEEPEVTVPKTTKKEKATTTKPTTTGVTTTRRPYQFPTRPPTTVTPTTVPTTMPTTEPTTQKVTTTIPGTTAPIEIPVQPAVPDPAE